MKDFPKLMIIVRLPVANITSLIMYTSQQVHIKFTEVKTFPVETIIGRLDKEKLDTCTIELLYRALINLQYIDFNIKCSRMLSVRCIPFTTNYITLEPS